MIQQPAGGPDQLSAAQGVSSSSHAVVVRRRLIECIDVPSLAPVTLITAPAGFGKSILAAQWMAQADHPVGWISLGPAANSVAVCRARFDAAITALSAAGEAQDPEPTFDTLIPRLQAIAEAQGAVSLVLDDYHSITNLDVHRLMDALLVQLPENVHLLILSRTLPPLALGRPRVLGRVREVTEADLRFTRAEAVEVVSAEGNDHLTTSHITRLVERTDGWIAGLRLALLALDGLAAEQIDPFIEALAEHQWLDDYIVEEVLNALPGELRGFVLRTAGLGVLEPELCDAVLEREDSAALIEETARRLVFVRRDSRGGAPVTYHALFAECVAHIARRHLPADDLRALHSRAAHWFEQHGQQEAAVEHALNADDRDMAVRLTKAMLPGLMDRDWSHSVTYWLGRLPPPIIAGDPDLAYAYVWSELLIGRAREAWNVFDHLERAWLDADDPVLRGRAMTCRVYSHLLLGHVSTPELQELRTSALALLPEEHAVERLHIWCGISADAYIGGDDEVADEAFRQAESCAMRLPPEQNMWFVHNTIHRPNQAALRGRLPVAIALYDRALDRLPARLRYWGGSLHFRLAAIHLERNELALAREQTAHYEPEIPTERWEAWHPEAWIVSAQLRRAAGEIEEAAAMLDDAISALEDAGAVVVVPRARALQAAWWLADGELDLARAWEQTTSTDQIGWGRTYGLNHGHLTVVQLRAAEGDFAAASATARRLIAEGVRLKRWAELIPFYVWDAVAQLGLGDEAEALEALRAALGIGMPGGFVRSFFPPGADPRPLLTVARDQLPPDGAAYVAALLASGAPGGEPATGPVRPPAVPVRAAPAAFISPLSRRETEVLDLLRGGGANREIAQALFLSEPTVKMHVRNVLAKLGVRNRTAAVVRARELGLLVDGDDGV